MLFKSAMRASCALVDSTSLSILLTETHSSGCCSSSHCTVWRIASSQVAAVDFSWQQLARRSRCPRYSGIFGGSGRSTCNFFAFMRTYSLRHKGQGAVPAVDAAKKLELLFEITWFRQDLQKIWPQAIACGVPVPMPSGLSQS